MVGMTTQPAIAGAQPELEEAQKKYEEGCACIRSGDLEKAVALLGGALEIRINNFGELASECASTYYKYGCALMYKAQSEEDILGESAQTASQRKEGGTYTAAAAGSEKQDKDEEEEDGNDDNQDVELQEEVESDMELAWKLLETARLIHSRQAGHATEEADVIATLAEISMEREDFPTAIEDLKSALEILEGLLQNDDRRLADIFFKLSLAHQFSNSPKEALSCCEQAVTVCENRLNRLRQEVAGSKEGEPADRKGKAPAESEPKPEQAPEGTVSGNVVLAEKDGAPSSAGPADEAAEAVKEIKELEELLVDLRDKVQELRESAKAPPLAGLQRTPLPSGGASGGSSSVQFGFDAPTLSTPQTTAITNLGVVGRGANRITPTAIVPQAGRITLVPNSAGSVATVRRVAPTPVVNAPASVVSAQESTPTSVAGGVEIPSGKKRVVQDGAGANGVAEPEHKKLKA